MGQLDSELATPSPDPAKVPQLKCSLEEKVVTLKLLDDDIVNYLEDEGALADEIEQSDDAAIIKAEKCLVEVPRSDSTARNFWRCLFCQEQPCEAA